MTLPARTIVFALVAATALLVAVSNACGGDDSSPDGSGTPGMPDTDGGHGSLIIAEPQGLVEHPLDGGDATVLIEAEGPSTFLLDPALSPNADRLAFIRQPPPKVDEDTFDAGSDLWIANRDGSDARALFEHEQPNQLIRYPQWQDDDNVLAIVQEISQAGGVTQVVYTLQRVSVATGARAKLLDDVLSFAVSPDGRRIAYARLAPGGGETLHAMDADGANQTVLVDMSSILSPFASIRFSPDGGTIAFASADQSQAPPVATEPASVPTTATPAPVPRSGARPIALAPAPLPLRALDGLPQDIWTIDAAGSQPSRVADLKEDLPALTWSGDGEHLYVIGVSALYDVNLQNGAVTSIGEGAFHAQLAWAP